jgi:hypothetical protein
MKRILIFIAIFIIIGTGVWYFFLGGKSAPTNPITTVFQSFFPSNTTTGVPDGTVTDVTGGNPTLATNRFTQITTRPIAGYSIFSLTNTTTTPNPTPTLPPITTTTIDHILRYVSRSNGYVYESKNGGRAIQATNIVVPNVYEAIFANNNATALVRFLKQDNQTIATYSIPIPPLNPDGTRTQQTGVYLPDNIDSLVLSPDTKQIARLTSEGQNGVISISTPTNTNKKDLLRTPFKEWLLSWPTQGTVYAQTKAAASASGYLYRVDSSAGRLRRIIGDIAGLTTSSPNGEYVLYSQSTQNSFVTKLFNTKTGTISAISLSILPEKCVWFTNNDIMCAGNNIVPEAIYPDSWYAGLTHFQDNLYRITPSTNTYTVVSEGGERPFDMTDLKLDEGQNLLYFIDKTTGLLWRVNL